MDNSDLYYLVRSLQARIEVLERELAELKPKQQGWSVDMTDPLR